MSTLNQEILNQELLDIFTSVVEEENIRTDYSGRGMFGSQCFGFVSENPLATFADILDSINESENNFDLIYDLSQMLRDAKTDSMGYSTITYFPSYSVHNDED